MQPSRDPQPGRAGSDEWCAGGLCSRRARTSAELAGCGGAEVTQKYEVTPIELSVDPEVNLHDFFYLVMSALVT